jgi:putative MATE family efflux protein
VLALEALHTAYHLIDLFWIGRLGAAASAALTTSLFAVWTVDGLAESVGIGILAQVARSLGAGDRKRAGYVAAQGVLVCLIFGVLLATAGRFLPPLLFNLLGVPAEVARFGSLYLSTLLIGAPALFVVMAAESIWRAKGDTVTPLKVIGASILANAFVNPFLIFGLGPFPELGIAGTAWATVFAWVGALAAFILLAGRAGSGIPLDRRALLHPDLRIMLRTVHIGLPRFLVSSLFSSVYLALAGLVARFGTAALAVLGIVNRLESMVYLACSAIGAGTATLVGQNLGALQPERAERAANTAARLAWALALAPGLAMIAVPGLLVRPFTDDPEVIRLSAPYLRVIGFCQVFMAWEIVYAHAFAGAGDTLPPMLVELPISISRVPLAWLASFPLGLGLMGVAWVLSLTCCLRGVWLALWFRTGRWKHRRL